MREPNMSKEEMRAGLAKGRRLIQEEWAAPMEIQWIDELVWEGAADVTPWQYDENFQCSRRKITGVDQKDHAHDRR